MDEKKKKKIIDGSSSHTRQKKMQMAALEKKKYSSSLLLLLLSRFSRVRLCATPQMANQQAPPSLGFSRQEHWSGLPFPSPVHEVKSESEVAQLCPTLHDPMDCSLPGSSVHGIFEKSTWVINSICFFQFSSVQLLSHVQLFTPPWNAAHQAFLSITNSRSLLKLMSIELVMPSNHLILCCPLILPPSLFPSIKVFSNELVLHIRWPKYCSFSFNISPPSKHSGLVSFRMDWLDLLEVQGTLKSLFQHHSSKASILQCSVL